MLGTFRGQKKVLKTLKLELQVVVGHHMHTRTRTQVLYKRNIVLLNTKLSIQIAKNTFQNGAGNLFKWQFIVILRCCFKELPHTSFDPKHLSDW